MNRRNLLRSILAAGMAPAVVSSGVIMPVREIILPKRAYVIGTIGFVPGMHRIVTWDGSDWVATGHSTLIERIQARLGERHEH